MRRDMDPVREAFRARKKAFWCRRRILLFLVALYLLTGGLEYVVIFPTAWSYVQSLGAESGDILGFTVSSYSASAMVAGIIGGRINDHYPKSTKTLTLICMVFMIGGNIQYLAGISITNIIVSRFLCGLGTGAGGAMLADICRVTDQKERTAILSFVNAGRQMGILMGPALQALLEVFHFPIGDFRVTPLNAPGLFMAGVWAVFALLVLLFMTDLTQEYEWLLGQEERLNGGDHNQLGNDDLARDILHGSYGSFSQSSSSSGIWEEERPLFTHSLSVGDYSIQQEHPVTISGVHHIPTENRIPTRVVPGFRQYLSEFMYDTTIVLLVIPFILYFCEIGLETVIPVITQESFHFTTFNVSLVYMGGGILSLLSFGLLAILSRHHVPDWFMVLFGCVLMILGCIWYIVYIPHFKSDDLDYLPQFLAGIVLFFVGFPIAGTASISLFSKGLSNETQGFGHGCRRAVTYLALILGPTWSASTVNTPNLYLCVTIALFIIFMAMYIMSLPGLREIESKQHHRVLSDESAEEEKRSLMASVEAMLS